MFKGAASIRFMNGGLRLPNTPIAYWILLARNLNPKTLNLGLRLTHTLHVGFFIFRNCYFQEGNELKMDMSLETGFQRALQTWGKWMEDNLDTEKTHVIFRSFSPVHFR
jgi:hypothetical protein